MAYKLLGLAVWRGGKWFLRRRNGAAYLPKPVLAGAGLTLVAALAGVLLAARRNGHAA
jgi:hypothetical protein